MNLNAAAMSGSKYVVTKDRRVVEYVSKQSVVRKLSTSMVATQCHDLRHN